MFVTSVSHLSGYGSLLSSHVRCSSSPSLHLVSSTPLASRFRFRPTNLNRSSPTVVHCSAANIYELSSKLYQLAEEVVDGPIELSTEIDPFAIPETTPLQGAASILLTGVITVLLFRSIRRRSKRAKEKRFRSTGEESVKTIDGEESLSSIKGDARKSAMALLGKTPEVGIPAPNALQTFSGAVVAGTIALFLYKFTVTVEGGFAGKVVSQNYSIRNLTVTVRTIITGLCYLATFVFAANSIGLTLLSLQLALNIGGSPENSRNDVEPPSKNIESPSDTASKKDERGSE